MPVDTICPIWGTAATVQHEGDTVLVEGARTAGAYHVYTGMVPDLEKLPIRVRTILTRWIIEKRRGLDPSFSVEVTADMVERARSARPLTVSAQVVGLLEYFIAGTRELGKGVGSTFSLGSKNLDRAMAYSGCQSLGEVNFLLQYLRSESLVVNGDGGVIVQVEGYNHVDEFWAAERMPVFSLGSIPALA